MWSNGTGKRLFFCGQEAIETLIWLTEAPPAERQGIDIPGDGGPFARWCTKLATGAGKTIVMAMLIAWQVLNKVIYPQDKRYSKNILAIAPGLTVRSRLEVLLPDGTGEFLRRVPSDSLGLTRTVPARQGEGHQLAQTQLGHRRADCQAQVGRQAGAKSDEAYVREVLGDMASARNLLVINDEAHHAWRVTRREYCRRVAGRSRRSDQVDRRPRSHSPRPGHPALLRLLRYAFSPCRRQEYRGDAFRLDRERLRLERRHRGRAW